MDDIDAEGELGSVFMYFSLEILRDETATFIVWQNQIQTKTLK